MTRLLARRVVLVVVLPVLFLSLVVLNIKSPPVALPNADPYTQFAKAQRDGRPLQARYWLSVDAAERGWTADRARIMGDVWRASGDVSRALPFYELAAQLDPHNAILEQMVAQAAVELHQWTSAVHALERLLAVTPDSRWAHFQLALIRAPVDPQAAQAHLLVVADSPAYRDQASRLLDVLRDNPSDSLMAMRVGLALMQLEQWAFAEAAFGHAAAANAPFPDALAYLGLARDRQGKDGSAALAQAVVLAPVNPQVRYLQGLHLRAVEDTVGSIEALALAVRLDPENPAFQAELATAYHLAGDLTQAEYWLQQAVLVSENDARFAELLALFYADHTDSLTAEGLAALETTVAQVPDNADARAGLGWALYQAGREDEGIAHIDAALELAALNPRALYYKGRTLLDTGDTAGAADYLARAARAESPFADDAQALLDTLEM